MQTVHDKNVQNQFGPRADAYVHSAVHAQGEDLTALDDIVRQAAPEHAIDLGCGGGHVAYTMARHAKKVTAADLSTDMLAAVASTAAAKGLQNIDTQQASVESLPFADGAFDFLGCRYSAHHWLDVEKGLREARRVLRAGSKAIFVDVYSPGKPLLDTHLQAVELLRDTSHVRDYSTAEWAGMLAHANFTVTSTRTWRVRMDFPVWVERMATPPDLVRAIRAVQESSPAEVRAHFAIEPDGSFLLDMLLVETVAG